MNWLLHQVLKAVNLYFMNNISKCAAVIALAFSILCTSAIGQQLAFPGAEGAGRFTSGGRGSLAQPTTVFAVTSLGDDNVPGTLRHAVSASTSTFPHRTIVFRVSGTIRLKTPLAIRGNTTIAGQTAPGDGICIADQPVSISGNNVILRYLRIRMGDRYQNLGKVDGSGNGDALGSLGYKNIIVDHCSISWSSDEACTIYRGDSLTIQWSMVTEPLNYSYHFEAGNNDYQEHAYGGIWGARRASFHHNIIAHVKGRAPRFAGSSTYSPGTVGQENANFYNNVVYNWIAYSTNGGEGGNYNIMNNYYKYGPGTSNSVTSGVAIRSMIMNPSKSTDLPYPKVYMAGNYVDGYQAATTRNWVGVAMAGGALADTSQSKVDTPFDISPYNIESTEDAYANVLAGAGATLPRRDTMDCRIVNDITWRIGRVIDVQGGFAHGTPFEETIGAWPTLKSKPAPTDSDSDGMPDAWEDANGLNKNNAADRQLVAANGYTNLENYLNSIVNTSPELFISAALTTFSAVVAAPSATQAYMLSGVNLNGTVTVQPPAGYEVSANNGATWFSNTQPLVLTPAAGTLATSSLLLRLNPAAAGAFKGYVLHFTSASDTTYLALDGLAVEAPQGWQVLIQWPMTSGNADNAAVRNPLIQPTQPSFSRFFVSNGSTVAAVPAYSSTHGQAFSPASDGSGLWTTASGGNGGNLSRLFYEQFVIQTVNGASVTVDSLVLNASFYNTSSNTRLAIVYSKSGFTIADSADVTGGLGPDGLPLAGSANGAYNTPVLLLNQTSSTTANYRFALNGASGVQLAIGESLTIRLYFSCGSTSNGRYAKLRDMNVIGRSGSTLPLSLFRFDGFERNGSALLQWQINDVREVAAFEVERRTAQTAFAKLASVSPAGISQKSFEFADDQLPQGVVYYRLKTLDKAGRSSLSRTIIINRRLAGTFALFPNPASQTITITYPALTKAGEIRMVNARGQVVSRMTIQQHSTQSTLNVQGLMPGSYRALVYAGGKRQGLNFVKQ